MSNINAVNPVIFKGWVKDMLCSALRGGHYVKGEGALRRRHYSQAYKDGHEDRYCVMGVLCNISPRSRWIQMRRSVGTGGRPVNAYSWNSIHGNVCLNFPTEEVLRWAVESGPMGKLAELSALNDSKTMTFPQMAKLIEEEF